MPTTMSRLATVIRVAIAPALRSVGIKVKIDNTAASIDPAHETTIAWALREAVTNVVKHCGARACRIMLETADGFTTLEVEDDVTAQSELAQALASRGWPTASTR